MPPYVPRKRLRDPSPARGGASSSAGESKRARTLVVPPRKKTLFDEIDAGSSTLRASAKGGAATSLLDDSDDEDDDSSSLTSLSDAEFEDVPVSRHGNDYDDVDEEDEDEDVEFEDVQAPFIPPPERPDPSGVLDLTLIRDTRVSLVNTFGKKGPSKRERLTRSATHRVHVQLLMWHNAIRNSWLCDPEVQGLLISYLPQSVWDEVQRWRRASRLDVLREEPRGRTANSSGKGKGKGKGKGIEKGKSTAPTERPSRDWSAAAQMLVSGAVDMSHGDPLFRLMKALSAWWKQRFKTTASGIRKVGYMPLERLDRLTKAFKSEEHDASKFGERIRSLEEFRRHAQECKGSRDVGSQLFTALLRGLGLEARMVASIQPLGFGWNKLEDADPEKEDGSRTWTQGPNGVGSSKADPPAKSTSTPSIPRTARPKRANEAQPSRPTRQNARKSNKTKEDESCYLNDLELAEINSDDDLVVEVPEKPAAKNTKKFDKDLEFPHYWTEVLSPVTNKYLSVDPVVKFVIATNRELVESLEPRGSKAEKARQIMAYAVGFSQDGTAKDVTVRYLKRQVTPGRTKGVRYPVEKVPVYNKHGKVKQYDQVDWFKSVMRGYSRGSKARPITEMDEEEDSTDLKPARYEKKEMKDGEETLQYYKQSKDYVLARHLKREEALLPDAPPVKVFRGKGKGGDVPEENVYLRKDVVQVKSAETWHKQGRAPLPGEEPLKMVPYRAATTNRKREIAEAEKASGHKVLQGLFSFDQTDWIIPPPIENGVIPKNEYGNIDLFAAHMCPEGAVHVPYRGVVKVCRRLGIDFAEAVVDFEFGHRMAVPVIQGCVVAEEHHDRVMEELAKDETERSRKEDEKRRRAALGMWRRMLMGMRIARRLREEYGEGVGGELHIFSRSGGKLLQPVAPDVPAPHEDEDTAGGFLPEGFEEEDEEEEEGKGKGTTQGGRAGDSRQTSSYFPVVDEDDEDVDGGLLVEDHRVDGLDASSSTALGGDISSTMDGGPRSRARTRRLPSQTVAEASLSGRG